jgi:hypothetical protein
MRCFIGRQVFAAVLFFSLTPGLAAQSTLTRDDDFVSQSSILAPSSFALVKLSADTFHNSDSEHRTEVEPDTLSWGSTIVSTFQVARIYAHGGADIGFATSTDGGKTWTSGYLPGLTVNYKGGTLASASDPAVSYDAKHGQWLISALAIPPNPDYGVAVSISRSTDGIHWSKPIITDQSSRDDKNWITCDNTSTSPYYGNCYTEWDEPNSNDEIFMSTSTDGGLTWGPAKSTADQALGIGGQPLVQPNGTVVVPIEGLSGNGGMVAFRSSDGGESWSSTVAIATINFHAEDGNLRSSPLPSAQVDGAGKIYVMWPDCRFRKGCSSNDMVVSTSTNGKTWTKPARIPIDPITSTVDHFIPGLGVDLATSGKTAHLALTYYYYPVASCNNSCQLKVGFTTSQDGGKTWTAGKHLAGPMNLDWLAPSQDGQMVADYLAVAYANGNPFGVFALAKSPSGGLLNEAMYTTKDPLLVLAAEPRFSSKGEKPVAKLPYVRKYYDDDGEYRVPRSSQLLKRIPSSTQK